MAIDKTRSFSIIKRPFLPDKMQKRDIKTPPAWRINIHASTERPCTDPDLHLSLTRVSVVLTPGSPWCLHPGLKRLSKPFWAKEKPVLMKNEAILTCFASIPGRFLFLLLIDTQNIIVFFRKRLRDATIVLQTRVFSFVIKKR